MSSFYILSFIVILDPGCGYFGKKDGGKISAMKSVSTSKLVILFLEEEEMNRSVV